MTALYIFLVILAVFLLLFAVLALNAVRAKQRGRRLAPQPDYYSEAELAQHGGVEAPAICRGDRGR